MKSDFNQGKIVQNWSITVNRMQYMSYFFFFGECFCADGFLCFQDVRQEWAEGWAGEEEATDRPDPGGKEEERRREKKEGCEGYCCLAAHRFASNWWKCCHADGKPVILIFLLPRENPNVELREGQLAVKTRIWRGRGEKQRLSFRALASPPMSPTVNVQCPPASLP